MHLVTPRRAARLLALAGVASAPVAGQVAAAVVGRSDPVFGQRCPNVHLIDPAGTPRLPTLTP